MEPKYQICFIRRDMRKRNKASSQCYLHYVSGKIPTTAFNWVVVQNSQDKGSKTERFWEELHALFIVCDKESFMLLCLWNTASCIEIASDLVKLHYSILEVRAIIKLK